MTDYIPAVYLTKIGLRREVLVKLNQDFIFTLESLEDARTAGRLETLLTPEERQHLTEQVAAWDAK